MSIFSLDASEFGYGLRPRGDLLQNVRACAVSHACGELPAVPAPAAAQGEFVIPNPQPQRLSNGNWQLLEKWPNHRTVENIGQRIWQLRRSCGMTQKQLHARTGVSLSWLSRIERRQMTPSGVTLEKLSGALGVGLNRFFVPETNSEALLEDPFILKLRPLMRQLDWEQWQSILKRLAAI